MSGGTWHKLAGEPVTIVAKPTACMMIDAEECLAMPDLQIGSGKRLKDALPPELFGRGRSTPQAIKFAEVEVIAEYSVLDRPWPGNHKNVFFWVALANGKCIGWNCTNEGSWSFLVYSKRPPRKTQ